MSRRTYTYGTKEIATGWDRPMGLFFLTVFDTEKVTEDNDEGVVFDNGFIPLNLVEVYRKLQEMNIPIPVCLNVDLAGDLRRGDMNLTHNYGVLE